MSNAPPQYYPEAGYPPPQQPGYPPQDYPLQGYPPPAPAPVVQQQQSSNVVVVQQSQPQVVQSVYQPRNSPNHLLHCIITFFCPWYLLIWLCICCIYGC